MFDEAVVPRAGRPVRRVGRSAARSPSRSYIAVGRNVERSGLRNHGCQPIAAGIERLAGGRPTACSAAAVAVSVIVWSARAAERPRRVERRRSSAARRVVAPSSVRCHGRVEHRAVDRRASASRRRLVEVGASTPSSSNRPSRSRPTHGAIGYEPHSIGSSTASRSTSNGTPVDGERADPAAGRRATIVAVAGRRCRTIDHRREACCDASGRATGDARRRSSGRPAGGRRADRRAGCACSSASRTTTTTSTAAQGWPTSSWNLRMFDDDAGVMNRSVADVGGRAARRQPVHALRRHVRRAAARAGSPPPGPSTPSRSSTPSSPSCAASGPPSRPAGSAPRCRSTLDQRRPGHGHHRPLTRVGDRSRRRTGAGRRGGCDGMRVDDGAARPSISIEHAAARQLEQRAARSTGRRRG